jgi:hypothetical protein
MLIKQLGWNKIANYKKKNVKVKSNIVKKILNWFNKIRFFFKSWKGKGIKASS